MNKDDGRPGWVSNRSRMNVATAGGGGLEGEGIGTPGEKRFEIFRIDGEVDRVQCADADRSDQDKECGRDCNQAKDGSAMDAHGDINTAESMIIPAEWWRSF